MRIGGTMGVVSSFAPGGVAMRELGGGGDGLATAAPAKRRGMGRETATEANPEANPGGGQGRNPLADRRQ